MNQLLESIITEFNESHLPTTEINVITTPQGINVISLFVNGVEMVKEVTLNEDDTFSTLETLVSDYN